MQMSKATSKSKQLLSYCKLFRRNIFWNAANRSKSKQPPEFENKEKFTQQKLKDVLFYNTEKITIKHISILTIYRPFAKKKIKKSTGTVFFFK